MFHAGIQKSLRQADERRVFQLFKVGFQFRPVGNKSLRVEL
jgi:hypothetical protein